MVARMSLKEGASPDRRAPLVDEGMLTGGVDGDGESAGLTQEALVMIMTLTGRADRVCAASSVCHHWHSLCMDPSIWREVFRLRWGTKSTSAADGGMVGWVNQGLVGAGDWRAKYASMHGQVMAGVRFECRWRENSSERAQAKKNQWFSGWRTDKADDPCVTIVISSTHLTIGDSHQYTYAAIPSFGKSADGFVFVAYAEGNKVEEFSVLTQQGAEMVDLVKSCINTILVQDEKKPFFQI